MARVLVTGSAQGLGLMAGQRLLELSHEVVLHARNEQRAEDTRRVAPRASAVLVGDVETIAGARSVAVQARRHGPFNAVIHNVGVGDEESRRETVDGLEHVFATNVLAAYMLTTLIDPPQRLVYLSSGMHRGGSPDLSDLNWKRRRWNGVQAYSDSKLYDLVLALAVARRWPRVQSNAVDPGWVPTRMGGRSAPDNLEEGVATQVWLAVSEDARARTSGGYWRHKRRSEHHRAASDERVQNELLAACAELTQVSLPKMPAGE